MKPEVQNTYSRIEKIAYYRSVISYLRSALNKAQSRLVALEEQERMAADSMAAFEPKKRKRAA